VSYKNQSHENQVNFCKVATKTKLILGRALAKSTHQNSHNIEANGTPHDTVQKVYSVNKGLFLGVFSLPWFAYMGRYRDATYRALINYAEIFYDLRY